MSSIRILSDRVANQIAAGEVIERPVAVVKELVENSIDAGATRVEVEFRNGGKSYIRIEDNGKGMSPDEALLCLERHATSKIRQAADLNEVSSFGFRGEALPSIASVSRFTLRTRSEGWDHGTEIRVNGGKLLEKKECGMPVGTVIEVAQLFNSVPARRKFLKTDPTETAHITYNTRLFAVAHPKIAFRVLENGRVLFQSPACDDFSDRVAEIWGRSLADALISVNASDPETGYRLSGLTAKPGIGRSTRRELVTLVNRRPVDSRTLGFAVLDAYHGRIQKGRYPPAFLFLEIDPSEVDVNVHPAKREVRFRNEGAIRRFVLNTISRTLEETSNSTKPKTDTDKVSLDHSSETPKAVPTPKSLLKTPPRADPPVPKQFPKDISAQKKLSTPSTAAPLQAHPSIGAHKRDHTIPGHDPTAWHLITVLKKKYALFETPKGLIMMHLRQSDQRVRFEKILEDYRDKEPPSQGLLIPIAIELEPLASETLIKNLDWINHQGFQIEEFGRNFYRIESIPAWLETEQAETFVRDMIDLLRQRGDTQRRNEITWEAVAKLATQTSYQRRDDLSQIAIQELLNQLLRCDSPHTSPSGKPTFIEMSWSDWERRFGKD